MAYWMYRCPKCKSLTETKFHRNNISKYKNDLIFCDRCRNILRINEDLTVTDFEEELRENARKRKAESRMEGPNRVEVLDLEDVL